MASIDISIVLISLPAIFNGIHINPLAPGETNYFLWILLGYMVVTTTLLVTFGRISDMFGRVRLYNMGFAIFTIGSILLWLTPGTGNTGALELILFRLIQGTGAGFLFANSAAILTDAFPTNQRGLALGINQVAAILGSVIGLILRIRGSNLTIGRVSTRRADREGMVIGWKPPQTSMLNEFIQTLPS